MTRSRIAVFEGYNAPRSFGRPSFGRPSYSRYGAQLFQNPRPMGRLGRRGYTVPPLYEPGSYGPVTSGGRRAKVLRRRSYKVKKGPNSPWQRKFKKIAKTCARKTRGKRRGGGTLSPYQRCMKVALKKAKSRK